MCNSLKIVLYKHLTLDKRFKIEYNINKYATIVFYKKHSIGDKKWSRL